MIVCALQYRIELWLVDKLFDAPPKSIREIILSWLVDRIVKYEHKHYPIE
jgi:hypothetical protein